MWFLYVDLCRLSQNSIVTDDENWFCICYVGQISQEIFSYSLHTSRQFSLFTPFCILLKYSYATTLKVMMKHKFNLKSLSCKDHNLGVISDSACFAEPHSPSTCNFCWFILHNSYKIPYFSLTMQLNLSLDPHHLISCLLECLTFQTWEMILPHLNLFSKLL